MNTININGRRWTRLELVALSTQKFEDLTAGLSENQGRHLTNIMNPILFHDNKTKQEIITIASTLQANRLMADPDHIKKAFITLMSEPCTPLYLSSDSVIKSVYDYETQAAG